MDKAPEGMHMDGDALCDYAEGILEGPALARADIHLRNCAACRKEIDALRGYFQEMADLEPAPAPADFLAKVHARLPRPSLWKKALAALSRPWRLIPLQIAFLTLLGVTGITAYLFQRGGLESEAVPMSAFQGAEPAGEAPGGEAPGGEAPGGEAPGGEAPGVVMRVPDAKASRAPVRKPPAPPAPRAKSYAGRKGEASPLDAAAPAPSPVQTRSEAAKPRSAPAEAQSVPESLSKRGISGEADRLSDRDVSAEESVPRANQPPDGHAPAEIGIRMAAMKDTTAMLAGLRAMGTETARQGTRDPEYLLRMPASRLAETRAYLRRYGALQGPEAAEPASSSSPIAVILRILPRDP